MNKVRIGFFSFTEITDPREHRAYNAWHQLDHMPEQFPLRGVAHGQRWVHTPACRRARLVCSPLFEPIHYVTLYLMTEPVEQTLEEFSALGAELSSLGRFHRHRRSHFGGPFRLIKNCAAPRTRISPEALPYRPNRGVFVVVHEPVEPVEPEQVDAYNEWLDVVHYPEMLEIDGIAGFWAFAEHEAVAGGSARALGARRVTVYYLDDDPLDVVARMNERASAMAETHHQPDFSGTMKLLFAAPLETVTPWEWDWFDEQT